MTVQNWLMVNKSTNILDNIVMWDGNPATWTPPAEYLMLVEATTPCKNWAWDEATSAWVLVVEPPASIGDAWDGTYIVTNDPQPIDPPPAQPTVSGAQTL